VPEIRWYSKYIKEKRWSTSESAFDCVAVVAKVLGLTTRQVRLTETSAMVTLGGQQRVLTAWEWEHMPLGAINGLLLSWLTSGGPQLDGAGGDLAKVPQK
jgi:hypothetical protein